MDIVRYHARMQKFTKRRKQFIQETLETMVSFRQGIAVTSCKIYKKPQSAEHRI